MASGGHPKVDIPGQCGHYRCNCKFLAPCCHKPFSCSICHEMKLHHNGDRKTITHVVCNNCQVLQKVRQTCQSCNIDFGEYFCTVCRLLDDNSSKLFYHCEDCRFCRIGTREYNFHCPKCNFCMPNILINNHKCVEGTAKRPCPICYHELHGTLEMCYLPPCSHLLHTKCYLELDKTSLKKDACPTCPVCRDKIAQPDLNPPSAPPDNCYARLNFGSQCINVTCCDCTQLSLVFPGHDLKCNVCHSDNILLNSDASS